MKFYAFVLLLSLALKLFWALPSENNFEPPCLAHSLSPPPAPSSSETSAALHRMHLETSKKTLLIESAWAGSIWSIIQLVQNDGVPIDHLEAGMTSVLIVASQTGNIQLINEAVRLGATVDLRNAHGETALFYANSKEIVQVFHGADANAVDENKRSILFEAVMVGDLKLVLFCTDRLHANVNLLDRSSMSPAALAA